RDDVCRIERAWNNPPRSTNRETRPAAPQDRASVQVKRLELVWALLDFESERRGLPVGKGSLELVLGIRRLGGYRLLRRDRHGPDERHDVVPGRRPVIPSGGQGERTIFLGETRGPECRDVVGSLGMEGDEGPCDRLALVGHLSLDGIQRD